jgi:demethylmenaquinone methyltransferase/2-methoxy-6-polyprenyl-1,4-benzoquinol methylase
VIGGRDVRLFDRFARLYGAVVPAARREPLARGLAFADRPVERVLDVAGGTGRAGRALGADASVTVVDAAGGMVREARRNGLAAVRGDAARLPVRSASVDAVLVVDALHHVANPTATVAEARRVLRPGGVLVIREFDPTTRLGRLLVAAEHAVGFESRFRSPDALAAVVERSGLASFVPDRGFGYTVVGVAAGADDAGAEAGAGDEWTATG